MQVASFLQDHDSVTAAATHLVSHIRTKMLAYITMVPTATDWYVRACVLAPGHTFLQPEVPTSRQKQIQSKTGQEFFETKNIVKSTITVMEQLHHHDPPFQHRFRNTLEEGTAQAQLLA